MFSNARARHTHVEATLNRPFAAQVADDLGGGWTLLGYARAATDDPYSEPPAADESLSASPPGVSKGERLVSDLRTDDAADPRCDDDGYQSGATPDGLKYRRRLSSRVVGLARRRAAEGTRAED